MVSVFPRAGGLCRLYPSLEFSFPPPPPTSTYQPARPLHALQNSILNASTISGGVARPTNEILAIYHCCSLLVRNGTTLDNHLVIAMGWRAMKPGVCMGSGLSRSLVGRWVCCALFSCRNPIKTVSFVVSHGSDARNFGPIDPTSKFRID